MTIRVRRLAYHLAVVVLPLATTAIVPRMARAQAPSDASGRSGRDVVVSLLATDDDAVAIESILRPRLERLGVHLKVERVGPLQADETPPDAPGRLARARIDLVALNAVRLRLAGRDTPSIDRLLPRQGSREALFEEVALVLESTIEGLLARPEPAPTPLPPPAPARPQAPEPEPAAPAPRAEAPRTVPVKMKLAFLSGLRPIADNVVAGGFGGGAGLARGRGPGSFGVWVTALYHLPVDVQTPRLTLHTGLVSLRAVPTITLFDWNRIELDAAAGAGTDLFTASPRDGHAPSDRLATSQLTPTFVVTGGVLLRAHLSTTTTLLLALGADVDFAPPRYATRDANDVVHTELSLWRVRPHLLAGISFSLFGGGP